MSESLRDARPVRTGQGGGVGDGPHIGFRHRSHHDAGGAPVGDYDVEDRAERMAAPLARDLLDSPAGLGGAPQRDGDGDVGPRLDLAEIVEANLDDLPADAHADTGIGEAA